jgi:GT2 family glycosyltransferase
LDRAKVFGADYALLLNNDTEVAPNSLGLLVEAMEADPDAGIAGPTVYYFDRRDVIWSAGGAIDWKRGCTWMVGLDQVEQGQFGKSPRTVDFVTGCALLIKMPVVERVGVLDQRFFAYYEDTEWCVRAQRAGFRVLHVPLAHIWHKISPSAQADSPQVHYYMTRNRLLFLKLAGARPSAWLHTVIAEYARTLLSWSLKPRWRYKRDQRRVMMQAIEDAWRGRWGQRSTDYRV